MAESIKTLISDYYLNPEDLKCGPHWRCGLECNSPCTMLVAYNAIQYCKEMQSKLEGLYGQAKSIGIYSGDMDSFQEDALTGCLRFKKPVNYSTLPMSFKRALVIGRFLRSKGVGKPLITREEFIQRKLEDIQTKFGLENSEALREAYELGQSQNPA